MDQKNKVLIIDPSAIFRRTLKEVIQTSQPQAVVNEAPNADQADGFLKGDSPDVVFMDIALPQGNGIRLIGRIKDMLPGVRIVVLTSHDSKEYREASIEYGADFFLSKEQAVGLPLVEVIHRTFSRSSNA